MSFGKVVIDCTGSQDQEDGDSDVQCLSASTVASRETMEGALDAQEAEPKPNRGADTKEGAAERQQERPGDKVSLVFGKETWMFAVVFGETTVLELKMLVHEEKFISSDTFSLWTLNNKDKLDELGVLEKEKHSTLWIKSDINLSGEEQDPLYRSRY